MKFAILSAVAMFGFLVAETSANAQGIVIGAGVRPGISVGVGIGAPGYYPYAPGVAYPVAPYGYAPGYAYAPPVVAPPVVVSPSVVVGGPIYRPYYGGYGVYRPYYYGHHRR